LSTSLLQISGSVGEVAESPWFVALDEEFFFVLRKRDHCEIISTAVTDYFAQDELFPQFKKLKVVTIKPLQAIANMPDGMG
tara:strand:+ start:3932 stop:4174 length:243 start_codon:yes stop_codon:yes gene_type:complete